MADVPLAKSPLPLADLAGADVATDGQVPTSDGAGGVAWEDSAGGGGGGTGDASWTAPTLLGSWVNFGSPTANAGYRKDGQGFVHLRGAVKTGTINTAIFTLPSGYRPAARGSYASGDSANKASRLDVEADGDVVPVGHPNSSIVSLDGITFYAEA